MKNNLAVLSGAIVLAFLPVLHSAAGPAAPADREFLTLKRNLVIPNRGSGKDGMVASITALRVDDQGRIYVLDGMDAKVKVFGSDGSFIRSFGRAGQGPGEFQYPMNMFLRKDGTIAVLDTVNMRLVGFSPEGADLEDIDLRTVDQNFCPEAETEAAVYGYRSINVDGSTIDELVRFDKKTKIVSVISKFSKKFVLWEMNCLSGRFFLRTGSNGELIWVYTENYELFHGSPSGLREGSITHKFPLLRVTEADKKMLVKKLFGGEDKLPKRFKLTWPEYFPPVAEMILDDRDWLCVRTYEKDAAGRSKYDVFDAGLVYRGSFHFGPSIMEIRNGRAYVKAEDEEGFPVIERYEMTLTK